MKYVLVWFLMCVSIAALTLTLGMQVWGDERCYAPVCGPMQFPPMVVV